MTFSQLKELLIGAISVDLVQVDLYHLDLSAGWGEDVTQIANDYFPDNRFSFRLPKGQKLNDLQNSIVNGNSGEIIFWVIGEDHPFNRLKLRVKFNLNNGKIALLITAVIDPSIVVAPVANDPGFDKRNYNIDSSLILSTYLPLFEDSLADNLSLTSIKFELDSALPVINEISSLQVNLTADLNKTMPGLRELLQLPNSSLEISGKTWLADNGNNFYGIRLFADINKTRSLAPFSLTLNKLGIVNESVFNFVENAYFSCPYLFLDAKFDIDHNPVPLGIRIYNFHSDIHFQAGLETLIHIGLTEMEKHLGLNADSFSTNIPDEIKGALQSFQLKEFGFYFNPSIGKVSRIYGNVAFDAEFTIAKDFPEQGRNLSAGIKGLGFEIGGQGKAPAIKVNGEIGIGNSFLEVEIIKNGKGFNLYGKLKKDNEINLSEIIKAFVKEPIALPELAVNILDFNFSNETGPIAWSFEIECKSALPVPFNNPVFYLREVDFSIDDTINCRLGAVFSVGPVDIAVSAAKDTSGWKFEGNTGPGQAIPVGAFIGTLWEHLLPDMAGHMIPDAIENLVAREISITLDVKEKFGFGAGITISNSQVMDEDYEIAGVVNAKWKPPGPHGFEFENLVLNIERNDTIQFSAEANFKVDTLDFNIIAVFNDGWEFEAKMDGEITLKKLAAAFKIEDKKIPASLNSIQLGDVHLSFNTKSSDKHFSGIGKFPLGKQPNETIADLVLKIDITHSDAGQAQTDFSGHLEIVPDENKKNEKLIFDIVFDKDNTSKTFIAAYHDETNKGLNLAGLLKGFGVPGVQDLKLAVKNVYFVKQGDKSLLHSDVNAALNLSGLPLIGKIFPPGKSVSLALKLLYPTAGFSDEEINKINGLLPQGLEQIEILKHDNKPTLDAGLQFKTTLNVGDTVFVLDLHIGKTEIENSHKSLQDVSSNAQASVATTVSADKLEGIKWININKNIAVIHFNRIGIAYKESQFYIFPDASIDVGGLSLSLDGLALSAKLSPFKLDYYLAGMSLDFSNGPIEIGAAFLRRTINGVDEFDGMALIKTAKLSITAMGSYSRDDEGHNSLFIFAYLNQALGGPAFFFVEGLAAAFGYNRSLIMPEVDQVTNFPLVRQVMEPQQIAAGQDKATFLKTQLDGLAKYIPPSVGNMFLAIGIKFNSFKLIDSFVLLAVSFGNHFEIDVIGQSNIIVPAELETGKPPLAKIKIGLVAKFQPAEGILTVRAQLTNDSYIISENCRLTGGAAFYCWFPKSAKEPQDKTPTESDHEGDFVMTMGGYHPAFNIPAHYPQVPRLELNWQVCPELAIKGDMYFALCSHAFMAGGHLQALYNDGPLSAWFNAGADFLVTWQPYHYDAEIYVDLGASYTYHLFGTHHITVDVGADVHIWGPEFAGHATVDLWITSVTVTFGNQNMTEPASLTWAEFKRKCLPEPDKICSLAVTKGQHGERNISGKKSYIVNPCELEITIDSAVPLNGITYKNEKNIRQGDKDIDYPGFGISPMDYSNFGISLAGKTNTPSSTDSSTHVISVSRKNPAVKSNGKDVIDIPPDNFSFKPIRKKMPAALWGNKFSHALNDAEKSIEVVTGVSITAQPQEAGNPVLYNLNATKDEVLTYQLEKYPVLVFDNAPELSQFFSG